MLSASEGEWIIDSTWLDHRQPAAERPQSGVRGQSARVACLSERGAHSALPAFLGGLQVQAREACNSYRTVSGSQRDKCRAAQSL